jgi:hypothetical protein
MEDFIKKNPQSENLMKRIGEKKEKMGKIMEKVESAFGKE